MTQKYTLSRVESCAQKRGCGVALYVANTRLILGRSGPVSNEPTLSGGTTDSAYRACTRSYREGGRAAPAHPHAFGVWLHAHAA